MQLHQTPTLYWRVRGLGSGQRVAAMLWVDRSRLWAWRILTSRSAAAVNTACNKDLFIIVCTTHEIWPKPSYLFCATAAGLPGQLAYSPVLAHGRRLRRPPTHELLIIAPNSHRSCARTWPTCVYACSSASATRLTPAPARPVPHRRPAGRPCGAGSRQCLGAAAWAAGTRWGRR